MRKNFKKTTMLFTALVLSIFSMSVLANARLIVANPGENADTEMRINWHTDTNVAASFVEFTKTSDTNWANAQRVNGVFHVSNSWNGVLTAIRPTPGASVVNVTQNIVVNRFRASLQNLDPGTEYMYRIGIGSTFSEVRRFRTGGKKEFSFAVIGDVHAYQPLPGRLTNAMNMVSRLNTAAGASGIDFILSTGDMLAFGGCYSEWEALFNHNNLRNNMYVGIIGNHDVYRAGAGGTESAAYRETYFIDAHNKPLNGYAGQEGASYWFKYGDVLWIVLNSMNLSNATRIAAAQAWAEQVILNNPSQYIFFVNHYQWFNGSGTAAAAFTNWNAFFDKHDVDLAISGNDHVYVRTHSIFNGARNHDLTRGTTYVINPSSDGDRGRDMPTLNDPNGRVAHRWTEGSNTIGGLLVKVNSNEITVSLYNRNSNLIDNVVIPAKRSAVPPTPAVTKVVPENLSNVNKKNNLELTFSRPMNRASVEGAISILPAGNLSYSWTNDFNLRINISALTYETSYALTIDGSKAKTMDGVQLAGDGENEGTNYVLNFSVAAEALGLEGDYFVPNNPGGGANWFPTLKEAFDAINAHPITGNVRILINGDFTSAQNVGLINGTDYSITIQSAGSTRHTITFSSGIDPGGPSGSIVIGAGSSMAWNSIAPARNITFDNLAIVTTAATSAGNTPIVIVDDSRDITIKNCSIRHNPTTGSYAVYVRGLNRTEPNIRNVMPQNITIENNEIINNAGSSAQVIAVLGDASSYTNATLANNVVIRNNILRGRTRGVWVRETNGLILSGNEFYIRQTSSAMNSMAFYVSGNARGDKFVTNNKFLELATSDISGGTNTGVKGIYISGGTATYFIENNYFTGFDKIATAAGTAQLQGIQVTLSTGVYHIRHNTFYMNKLARPLASTISTTPTGTGPSYSAINFSNATTPTTHIHNNLFVSAEDAFPNFFFRGNAPANLAANDNVFVFQAGTTHARMASGTFPTGLRTAESVAFANTTAGSFNLDILAGSASERDEALAVPRMPSVLTDIHGTARWTITYAGAHEALSFEETVELPDNYPHPDQDEDVEAKEFYEFFHHESKDAPWMNAGNIRRTIHRNGKLYVLTKAPNPEILIKDAETLELIRKMDLTGVSGGLNGVTLSDIAFTADDKLLACNLAVVPSTSVSTGAFLNDRFKVYIWDNDDAQPEIFYELWRNLVPPFDLASIQAGTASPEAMLGNWGNGYWNNGRLGETMAVSGPSWNATVYMPAFSADANTGAGETFRMAAHRIINGEVVETQYRMRIGLPAASTTHQPFGAGFNFGGSGNFQLMISPLAPNRFIFKSNATSSIPVPAEYEWNWSDEQRATLQQTGTFATDCNFTLLNSTGANYFRYAGRAYMAAPVALSGQTVDRMYPGVVLFDITDGLNNAVKISEVLSEHPHIFLPPSATYMKAFGVVKNEHIYLSVLAENYGFATFATYAPNNVNIKTPTQLLEVRVYPNPVQATLHIEADFEINSIRLIDITGRIIKNISGHQTLVDMTDVQAGNYILFVNDTPVRVVKR